MSTELRDALIAASNAAPAVEAPVAAAPVAAPTPAAPAPVASAPAVQAPTPAAAPVASQEGVTAPAPSPEGMTRDPLTGKFVAKDPTAPAAPAVVDPNAPAVPPVAAPAPSEMSQAQPYAKAPGTWTPAAREHWASIPIEVRQEVMKREVEVSRALSATVNARKFSQEFEQTIQPYMGFIAAEGSTPLQAVNYMMQTAALFRVGTAVQKANAVAGLIHQFGVPLEMLDSILAGQQVQENNPASLVQREVQRALQPIMGQFQQRQQQQESQVGNQVDQELATFAADPKNEFFEDVKHTMADVIDIAVRRGEQISLTQAYERATLLTEPVRRVIETRRNAQSAQRDTQLAREAQNAAISVQPSSQANVAEATPGDSVRDSINYAIAKASGR